MSTNINRRFKMFREEDIEGSFFTSEKRSLFTRARDFLGFNIFCFGMRIMGERKRTAVLRHIFFLQIAQSPTSALVDYYDPDMEMKIQ